MQEKISQIIQSALPDATVYVFDPQNDGQHFESIVISPSFVGMPLVRQHQAVMKPLKEAFETDVHALRLKTFTPEKWEKSKHQYGLS
jgi:acid stress-induced BolA-like protein IbaG/YrbA